jgi:hypothetical protein
VPRACAALSFAGGARSSTCRGGAIKHVQFWPRRPPPSVPETTVPSVPAPGQPHAHANGEHLVDAGGGVMVDEDLFGHEA